MTQLRIVFMGTPEFAVSILETLVNSSQINIVGVVTAPDKPAGRGRQIKMSAVKEFSLNHDLVLLQPPNLKDSEFIKELTELNAELFVVVAFRMLPEVVWSMPQKGTINLHASLLPQYRGAAPINWTIINGESRSGVTTFFIEKEIDTGKIIEQRSLVIGSNESVGDLYSRLMKLGAETTLSSVLKIKEGNVVGISQDDTILNEKRRIAPKIFKNDCRIDFRKTAQEVHNFCRGLDPFPGAWCEFNMGNESITKTFKLFSTLITDLSSDSKSKITKNELGILIPCSDFYLLVKEIQSDGKRKMTSKDYLVGHDIEGYTISY
ncbi:MAG: methionyl-tRNA formyltransferase [Crocinitomicaceae bacterium]|jgi:methionyl-tRNA formyltransferase